MNPLHILIFKEDDKVRLARKPTKDDYVKSLNCWIARHFYILAFLAILILLLIFIGLCFALVGTSAVESGTYYYHLK